MEIIGITLFWALLAIIIGIIANARGRSGIAWFVIALLISPLIAVVILAMVPSKSKPAEPTPTPAQAAEPARKTKRCPQCAEDIMFEALRCKHCGAEIPPEPVRPPETTEDAIARFGIRKEAGQYLYGLYRYNDVEEAIAAARAEHGET